MGEATTFVAGAAILGAQMAVGGAVAKALGPSTLAWGATIAVVLLSLSAGYWLGGCAADRRPDPRSFSLLVLSGGIGLLIGTVAIRALLDAAARHGGPLGPASVLALAGGLALLAVPMVLLGAVLPYAVRLQLPGAVYAGGLVGRFYAISTAGSLAGTFVVVLALDPALGALDSCVVLGLLVAGTSLAAFALTRTSGAGGGREAAARPRASEPSAARGVGRVSHGA